MNPVRPFALLALLLLVLAAFPATAQTGSTVVTGERGQTVRVSTRVLEPFVLRENGKLTGFSIDLWERIAERMGVVTQYDVRPTLPELLGSVENGQDDLAIAAISITAQREARFDFSHPIFDSGLAILVPEGTGEMGLLDLVISWSAQLLPALGIGVALILIAAHLVWLSERHRREPDIDVVRPYFPGIFQAAFWVATLMGGQAEGMPKRPLSRVIAVMWIYAGLVFVAYFTAFATSTMTVQQLKTGISSPNDLVGKKVASVEGSSAAKYLQSMEIEVSTYPNVGDAIKALLAKSEMAVVYDSPILQHYVGKHGRGKVRIAGADFRQEKYGILFPQGSQLRKRVNEQLLQIREDGTFLELHQKWFGGGG
jgi:polar amino acid transport system substrate-binding protein